MCSQGCAWWLLVIPFWFCLCLIASRPSKSEYREEGGVPPPRGEDDMSDKHEPTDRTGYPAKWRGVCPECGTDLPPMPASAEQEPCGSCGGPIR